MSSLQVLGQRIGRYWSIYAFGAVALAVLSLGQVVAFTHFLGPAQLGRLAALQAFGALLTLLLIVGTLQGTMGRVLGTRGDDDEGVEDDDVPIAPTEDRTRSIATGLTIMLTGGIVVVTLSWVFAPTLARWLTGTEANAGLVRAVACAGAAGAPFRLFLVYPRYARRAARFVGLEVGRMVIGVAAAVVLLAAGMGIEGAVVGMVVGDIGSVFVGMWVNRREIELRFSPSEAREIFKLGISFAPVVIANYTILTGDILLLSAFASPSAVGRYRLAGSVARMAIFPVQVFLYAWGPLTKSPIQAAAEEESSAGEVATLLFRYAVVAGVFIILASSLYADTVVKIAPHAYHGAASLLPFIALAYVLRALFVILYRTSQFRTKRKVFIIVYGSAALVFIGVGLFLIPAVGALGAGISRVVAFGITVTVMAVTSQRSDVPLPIAWGPVSMAVLLGVVAAGVGILGLAVSPLLAILGPLAYVGLVIATRVVPREHIRPLLKMFTSLQPGDRRRRTERRLRSLSQSDVSLLRRAVRENVTLEQIAADRGEAPAETLATLARIFNFLSPLDGERIDPTAASYALSFNLIALHDRQGRQLIMEGASPRALDSVEETVKVLRRIPLRRWDPFDPDGGHPPLLRSSTS